MKLYLHINGVFYEKQADCPSKSFEAVEFPFAASPKADFVAWLNQNAGIAAKVAPIGDLLSPAENVGSTGDLPVDRYVAKVAAQTPPRRDYFDAQHPLTVMAIEDWCEKAQPHQLGIAIHAAAQRLQVIAQEQEKRMQ